MNSPRVLVADDSPLVLRMLEKMLSGAGYEVLTAGDGLEAIEKAINEDVSLVILDVMMPRMTGYQACRLLKSEPATSDLPVVILTSRDQAGDRFWGLQTGADHYVTKDSDPQRILALVKQILSGDASSKPRPAGEGRRTSVDILSRVNEMLDRKLYEATILSEIGRVARSIVHFDETFTSVMDLVAARVVDFSVGAMVFVDGDELHLLLTQQRPTSSALVDETKARVLAAVTQHTVFSRVHTRLFPARGSGPEEASLVAFTSYPLVTNDRLSGMLAFSGKAVARISRETGELMTLVANQAHIVTENSRLFDKVRNLSMRDSLTDLYNHRHSMELLNSEFLRVGRYEGGMSVVMVDLDNFKQVNDLNGHQVGDLVLRDAARVMKEQLRTVDVLGRYGGEEFLVILPQTSHESASQTAERLRTAVEKHVFNVGGQGGLKVTASFGVATYPSKDVDSPGSLIRVADEKLYRAKEDGRNRVG